jgi:broad specificity phosphatase PhoE
MVRLILLCHGSTAATRAARFPLDEDLEDRAIAKVRAIRGSFGANTMAKCAPSRCAVETAAELGLDAIVDERLRDCDFGRWKGRSISDVGREEPQSLLTFMADPGAAPHGGESFADVLARASAWLDDLMTTPGKHIAVTHAPFIRAAILAAIGGKPEQGLRIDIAPLSCTELRSDGSRWVWRASSSLGD